MAKLFRYIQYLYRVHKNAFVVLFCNDLALRSQIFQSHAGRQKEKPLGYIGKTAEFSRKFQPRSLFRCLPGVHRTVLLQKTYDLPRFFSIMPTQFCDAFIYIDSDFSMTGQKSLYVQFFDDIETL